ncbi:MAG: sigma 54-interacting transcriptional regulator, partial [Firmicutes bacterium]|nr:sigma 54-interacting transcriptional regulator [Bacillota bacterium]
MKNFIEKGELMPTCNSFNSGPLSGLLEGIIQFLSYPTVLYNSHNNTTVFNQAALAIKEIEPGDNKKGPVKFFADLFEESPSFYVSCEHKVFSIVYLPLEDNKEKLTLAVFIPSLAEEHPPACLRQDLKDIIEASYDGIIVADGKGVILAANQAYERLTGNKASDIAGRKICELSQEKFQTASLVDLVLNRKEPVSNTQYSPTHHKCLMVTGTPVFNHDDQVRWVILYYKDITEINQLQYELEHVRGITQRYSSELTEIRKQVVKETNIIANSQAIKKVIELALHVAKVDSTVLIQGESGAGKELIAKIIHNNSAGSLGPFIKVNCTAIPESLIESELFGYEPGAFTG